MLRHETVEPGTFALLKQLQSLPFLDGVRLVGGTALALQLGHRKSVDLDLFGFWKPAEALQKHLDEFQNVKKTGGQEKMQFYQIDNVKADFVTYPFAWLDPPVEEDGVRLAGVRDIGAMKLLAITKRGAKKDFVDLCFLLQRFSVSEMVGWFKEKYPAFDPFLVMRSLAYFEDADSDLPPTMLVPFDWEEAKSAIREAVRAYAR